MRVRHPHPGFVHPKGFTLIELMIVIAIFAVLIPSALPILQDYTFRSKVDESLSLFSGLKTNSAQYCHRDPNM